MAYLSISETQTSRTSMTPMSAMYTYSATRGQAVFSYAGMSQPPALPQYAESHQGVLLPPDT